MKLAKSISILSATALALGTAIPAFAEAPTPSSGEQTGTGKTTLKIIVDGTEYGGTDDPSNPMAITDPEETGYDADAPGTNIAFTAPTELDFVVKANGDMLCPSETATAIHNESVYGIHVSSVDVDAPSGWNLVTDSNFASSTAANTVSMNFGPATDDNERLSISTCLTQTSIANGLAKWGMSAKGADNNKDKLYLSLDGKAKNLNAGYGAFTEFASIHWYLTAGGEGTRYIAPEDRISINKAAATNGTFKVSSTAGGTDDLAYAAANDVAYIVAEPADGYKVESMSVTKVSDSSVVAVTRESGASVGSFTIPAEAVSVSVAFAEEPPLERYTMRELQTISADIRANGTNSQYYSTFNAFAQAGENVTVTLHDGITTKNATLVDASAGYGLVFMLDSIGSANMNSSDTNAGGWSSSELRASLRSGGALYNQYLAGMTMSLADATPQAVAPASVTTYSADANGGGDMGGTPQQQTTTGETFFLASVTEIYGPTSSSQMYNSWTEGARYETSCYQFDYFANLGVTGSSCSALANANGFAKAAGSSWWLRSATTSKDTYFWRVISNGRPNDGGADYSNGVLPCFCL